MNSTSPSQAHKRNGIYRILFSRFHTNASSTEHIVYLMNLCNMLPSAPPFTSLHIVMPIAFRKTLISMFMRALCNATASSAQNTRYDDGFSLCSSASRFQFGSHWGKRRFHFPLYSYCWLPGLHSERKYRKWYLNPLEVSTISEKWLC